MATQVILSAANYNGQVEAQFISPKFVTEYSARAFRSGEHASLVSMCAGKRVRVHVEYLHTNDRGDADEYVPGVHVGSAKVRRASPLVNRVTLRTFALPAALLATLLAPLPAYAKPQPVQCAAAHAYALDRTVGLEG